MVNGSFVVESDRTITDGEIDFSIESRVFDEPELPQQMVKRRPEIVANIADKQGDVGVNLFGLHKPEDTLSSISITHNLIDNLVGVTLLHTLNQAISDLEMFLCSAEFEERAIQRVHIIYPPYG
jgi:hypothetical protein